MLSAGLPKRTFGTGTDAIPPPNQIYSIIALDEDWYNWTHSSLWSHFDHK